MRSAFWLLPVVSAFVDGSALPPVDAHAPRPRVAVEVRQRGSGDSLLITAAELRERLTRPGVVLIHIGERADYNAGHIPGARFLPYAAVAMQGRNGVMLELPTVARLDSVFASLGVSNDSRIVLYWSRDWYSPTTRVFLTLDYLGLGRRTSILDGGFPAWTAAGGQITTEIPRILPGRLTARPRAEVIVDAETVRGAIGDSNVALIDARDPRFYTGQADGNAPRSGHIAGAANVPFNTLLADNGTFKNREALEEILAAAGATPPKRVIAYCHIGQQATVVYFAARLLGRDVRLYDGSWDEWSRRQDLPIETGSGPSKR